MLTNERISSRLNEMEGDQEIQEFEKIKCQVINLGLLLWLIQRFLLMIAVSECDTKEKIKWCCGYLRRARKNCDVFHQLFAAMPITLSSSAAMLSKYPTTKDSKRNSIFCHRVSNHNIFTLLTQSQLMMWCCVFLSSPSFSPIPLAYCVMYVLNKLSMLCSHNWFFYPILSPSTIFVSITISTVDGTII